ncbi:synaptic vesicle glycoprotein 2B [Manduca sexta]|uniref:Major facilitator superfamily (MFS) profile domain-containing protein n=1 Tax=Manduca sexta TaxID=7130 RepID=A0A921ZIY1_MANSE|nr:synaptic vesicle glycoprotein 2B [Manduca sexta]KAG6458862.1 hypothetical protein O3G_MSEX011091 [Manduca sexta]
MSDVNLPALAEADKSHVQKTPVAMQEINEAYKACKFGLFHVKLLVITFVGFVAGVAVSNTTAYLLPSAECDLKMSLVQKGLLNAMPYLGMLFSTVIAGFLTDTFGRKIFVVFGYGGMFLFLFIAGSSQTFEVLITAKFFEGILFATSFSAVVTLTSEFCYHEIRDRVILCQSSFAGSAQIVIPGMSWAILMQDWKLTIFEGRFELNTWNFYLYLMSLWSLSACLLYTLFIPESPKYLITQKKYDEARDILVHMYRTNTGKPAETYPYINLWKDKAKRLPEVDEEQPKNIRHQIVVGLHNIKPMFRKPLVIYLLLISLNNFLIMALYNILRLWFPQLSTIVEHYNLSSDKDLCVMLDLYTNDLKAASHNASSSDVCIPNLSGAETYINSIIIGCVCLLPYFISGVLINKVGKKNMLITAGLICIIMTLGLRWANSKTVMVSLFATNVAVAQVMMSLNQALIMEYFPTTIRTLAISTIMMTGRIGTLIGNIAFPVLLDKGCVIPFYTMTGMMICVTTIALFLPKKK